jgi:O-Antigen ligase
VPRAALVGVAGLLALACWNALSLRWSAVPSLARDEALLVVFYLLVLAVPLLVVRHPGDRRLATVVVVALLVALTLATFIALLTAAHPGDDYEHGRLTFPISYVNAQAALFLIGFWPAVALASGRRGHVLLRGAACGGATGLLAAWLMTQSKGGLLAVAASGVVLFAVSPRRLRLVVPAVVAAALVAASYAPLTRPYRHRGSADFGGAIRSAAWWALALAAVAALAGLVYAAVDRRVSVPERGRRLAGAVLLFAVAGTVIGTAVAFFVTIDHPGRYVEKKWHSFKTLPAHERGSSHLVSLGSNRYDFWRVELRDFVHHPLAGIGARGFAQSYLEQRRSLETPARGHSLELDLLSETGLAGLALFALGVGAPLVAAARRARGSLLSAGLFAALLGWLLHASVDWIWTVPADGVPFFLLLGIAIAGGGRPLAGRVAVPAAVGVLAIVLVGFVPPWASARYSARALASDANASDVRWARRLDPLSVAPFVAEAETAPNAPAKVAALRHAVAKEPRIAAWRYLLGRAYLAAGERRQARTMLLTAQRLNPRDELIAAAVRRARR